MGGKRGHMLYFQQYRSIKKKVSRLFLKKNQQVNMRLTFANATISWNCGQAFCFTKLWGLHGATDLTTPYHILDSDDWSVELIHYGEYKNISVATYLFKVRK